MQLEQYEKEHIEIMRRLAPECMVLLKSNGDFPLAAPEKVALYGSGARRTIKGGNGSGNVYSRFYTTIEEGLETAGFSITTKSWKSMKMSIVRHEKNLCKTLSVRQRNSINRHF